MKSMTGEIGKLSLNGEQVGGFKYWTAIQNKTPLHTRVVASQFWIFKKPATDKLQADFHSRFRDEDELELVYSREVAVKLPDCPLDKMVTQVLEMDLGSFDWLQGLAK